MKIRPEHYAHMLEAIRPLAPRFAGHRLALQGDPRVRNVSMRLRWDAFDGAGLTAFACSTLYAYCDDNHIDTALRKIMRELGEGI